MSQPAQSPGDLSAPEGATATALRQRNRQLQFLSETFPEGVVYQYAVTGNGQKLLTYLGRGAEKIFGERPPKLPIDVQWLTARILPEDEPGIAAAGERSRRDLSRLFHDVRIRATDGTVRWVSIRTQPRELDDGDVVWDGVIIDVTAQHHTEESVQRKIDFLRALNQTTLDLLGRRNVHELLQTLAERAAQLLQSPHAEISLVENDELVVRAYSLGHEYLAGDRVRRGEPALSWRAVDTRTPVVTERYAGHPDRRTVYRRKMLHAVAIFPILRGSDCLGVLGLAREEPGRAFTESEVQEGVLLAQMAALVLDNATIHEDAIREAERRTKALRESEERFRGVFDKSPIVIGVLSMPERRIVELNAAALEAFGYTRDEAIGKTAVELNLWADGAVRDRFVSQLKDAGSVSGVEVEMRRKNGETFPVIYTACIVSIGGRPYSLNLLLDITARKQSEAARDQSLALMRATLESTADGILVVNDHGHIETFNRNFAEMWRLASDPELAPDLSRPIDPVTEERTISAILGQLVAPENFLASVREVYTRSEQEVFDVLQCKDGRVFERYSRPQLVGGTPAGRVWSFRDTTTRRRTDAALRESEERFRVLAEVSPVGIFRCDPTGATTFVNRRWCELAGMSAEEAMGDGWTKALHPDDREHVAAAWAEAVKHGESSAAEYRFVRPDGSVIWLIGQSRRQTHADGEPAGYVGTVTDVTSLKRAEEERKNFEEQLRQSQKMESLGTLAGGIAHDFNNILNGTFGFLDLARLELPEGHPVHAWLDRISASSQRARELVRQILTFSRKKEGERIPLRLHTVVAEALRLLRSTMPPSVLIEPMISPDTPPALADATQIHQVVLNLCTNAWHAMPERGGRISIALEPCAISAAQAATNPDLRPGPYARLTVTDDGCGMSAETLEHIFEPFFTTKDTGKGTGLGLAVVHGIMKSHDGAIIVRSKVGHGTTFELYFPAVSAEPTPPPFVPQEIPRGHGERILVVDDDAVSGFALEKIVESLGYHVTRLTRPEEALARFAAAPSGFDLVLSDLAMPGMDGEELIGHLLKIRPDLPVVVASGYVETARQRILEKGVARAVLGKPVARPELARVLAQSLRAAK